MSSAGHYRQTREWAAGETYLRRFDVGPMSGNRTESPGQLCLVRLSYGQQSQQGLVLADVRIADDGTVLDGIDLPCALTVEAPVNIVLRPVGPMPEAVSVACIVSPVSGQVDQYAVRSVVGAPGAVIAIPQWVRVVYCIAPAMFTFLDRAATPLSGSLDDWNVRPPIATQLRVDVAGTFLLSF